MSRPEEGDAGAPSARVAPVIPLFGRAPHDVEHAPSERHPAHGRARGLADSDDEDRARPTLRAVNPIESPGAGAPAEGRSAGAEGHPEGHLGGPERADDPVERREAAERILLRKLRAKALSVSEARLLLRGEGAAPDDVDEIVDDCLRRGYLDDRTLAELLVEAGVQRKNQGRAVLARSLAQRGLDRSLVDEVLAELPDDDAEHALDYARAKARSMARLDHETALRRLVGQLARRGFGGAVAMNAAKQALRDAAAPRTAGVRFRDSE